MWWHVEYTKSGSDRGHHEDPQKAPGIWQTEGVSTSEQDGWPWTGFREKRLLILTCPGWERPAATRAWCCPSCPCPRVGLHVSPWWGRRGRGGRRDAVPRQGRGRTDLRSRLGPSCSLAVEDLPRNDSAYYSLHCRPGSSYGCGDDGENDPLTPFRPQTESHGHASLDEIDCSLRSSPLLPVNFHKRNTWKKLIPNVRVITFCILVHQLSMMHDRTISFFASPLKLLRSNFTSNYLNWEPEWKWRRILKWGMMGCKDGIAIKIVPIPKTPTVSGRKEKKTFRLDQHQQTLSLNKLGDVKGS